MSPDERRHPGGLAPEREPLATTFAAEVDEDAFEEDHEEDLRVSGMGAMLSDRRRLTFGVLLIVALVAAIYVLLPRVVGLDNELARISDAAWYWVVIAIAFNVAAFVAYVALFRGVLGGSGASAVRERLDFRASYQITMAGLAATRIFSAAGAGGIVLTYWALRKAGMARRRSACRMVAFLVVMYSVYALALIVFGILLRTGVLAGDAPVAGTIVPAGLAGGAMLVATLIALIPDGLERAWHRRDASEGWWRGWRRSRPRRPRACARRSPTCATRVEERSRSSAPSASGRRTSACSGRASRRSEEMSHSPSWCRGSSWGWPPTWFPRQPAASARSTPG
jgi:hypothetical protein